MKYVCICTRTSVAFSFHFPLIFQFSFMTHIQFYTKLAWEINREMVTKYLEDKTFIFIWNKMSSYWWNIPRWVAPAVFILTTCIAVCDENFVTFLFQWCGKFTITLIWLYCLVLDHKVNEPSPLPSVELSAWRSVPQRSVHGHRSIYNDWVRPITSPEGEWERAR